MNRAMELYKVDRTHKPHCELDEEDRQIGSPRPPLFQTIQSTFYSDAIFSLPEETESRGCLGVAGWAIGWKQSETEHGGGRFLGGVCANTPGCFLKRGGAACGRTIQDVGDKIDFKSAVEGLWMGTDGTVWGEG